jgi:ankyrin repeat protein
MSDKSQYWAPQAGEQGMNALHYAAYCQDLAEVRRCVEQGFDVNQQDDGGWTP